VPGSRADEEDVRVNGEQKETDVAHLHYRLGRLGSLEITADLVRDEKYRPVIPYTMKVAGYLRRPDSFKRSENSFCPSIRMTRDTPDEVVEAIYKEVLTSIHDRHVDYYGKIRWYYRLEWKNVYNDDGYWMVVPVESPEKDAKG
jgi:hypothetical protein